MLAVYDYPYPSLVPTMPTTSPVPSFERGPAVHMNHWVWNNLKEGGGNKSPYQPKDKKRQHAIITNFDFQTEEPDTSRFASSTNNVWKYAETGVTVVTTYPSTPTPASRLRRV